MSVENIPPYESHQMESRLPTYLRARHVADVPEDVDYIMEHLNDPNYDLKKPMLPAVGSEDYLGEKTKKAYTHSDTDSQYGSEPYTRADSRNSTGIEFDDESPYPEVRAAVASTDDPTMPVNTFRMWFIGLIFSLVIPSINQFFNSRFPSVFISGIVVQLIALPIGKLFAKVLPTYRVKVFGQSFSLNPGPFNIKEHVCITIMSNISSTGAYATEIFAAQRLFYGQTASLSYQILMTLGMQIVGFSFGGLLRQFAVWPASMIWPGALVNAALFNTLHHSYGKTDGHMSRERFFCYAAIGAFCYYWLPGYLFMALSVFNWVCWIAPQNPTVNILFGTQTGLGMSLFSFDWSMISYVSSPMVTPWWAALNGFGAMVVVYWIITPALYFTNAFNSQYLPMLGTRSYDNTGMRYNASAVVTDGIFDAEKYREYSPVLTPITLTMLYARDFALFPAVIVHTLLWFRRDIIKRFRPSQARERDVHSRLMQAYKEVPWTWYGAIGLISVLFILVSIEIGKTQLPIWAALFALLIAAIMAVPLAMLQAITNQGASLQVVYELIIGYILPGKPVANSVFKGLALMGGTQAVAFAGDLKLGMYTKIPHRTMFAIQLAATIVSSLAVIGVQEWSFNNIPDFCMPEQVNGFTCPGTNLFATSSLIWGGIGPARMFASDTYGPMYWFFLVGALMPVPFYLAARRWPLSFWRYINIPVALAGSAAFNPATGSNYFMWALTCFIFNYLIRKYRFGWWLRYNYILSAALDAGTILCMLVIFFALQFPSGPTGEGFFVDWWGNNVFSNTLDAEAVTLRVLDEGQIFGPTTWQ